MGLLARVQREFETLYNDPLPEICVEDYLTDESAGAKTDEVLFVREEEEGLEVSLYINRRLLRRLEKQRPWRRLESTDLDAFCTVIEGVSHFFTVVSRASSRRPVSQLELEVQAEVDKYLFCFFYLESQGVSFSAAALRTHLFDAYRLLPSLNEEQRHRYELANRLAFRYCASLEELTAPSRRRQLIDEVRRFRRIDLGEKIRLAS